MTKKYFICFMPTEIVMEIFFQLPSKDLLKCRAVCVRWHQIIDRLKNNKMLWRKNCRTDYPDIFESAYLKSQPGLSWYQLYRSLSLWSKISHARDTVSQLVSVKHRNNEVRAIHGLRGGIIAIHKEKDIVYYDANTLKQSGRHTITGQYAKYEEFNDIILILNRNLELYMLKVIENCSFTLDTLYNVRTFIINRNIIYYLSENNDIYISEIVNDKFVSKKLKHVPFAASALGFRDGSLYILTSDCSSFVLVNGEFKYVESFLLCTNLVTELKKYQYMDLLSWGTYFRTVSSINKDLTPTPIYHVTTTLTYGHVIFTGTNWGELYISTLVNNPLKQPKQLKHYSFIDPKDTFSLTMVPITHIDIVEGEDKHTVLVAMPKRIVAIKFVHEFNEPLSIIPSIKAMKVESQTI